MKKETQFNIAIVFVVIGITLIGWGIGRIFYYCTEGIIIGLGTGLFISAMKILQVFKRRDVYEK